MTDPPAADARFSLKTITLNPGAKESLEVTAVTAVVTRETAGYIERVTGDVLPAAPAPHDYLEVTVTIGQLRRLLSAAGQVPGTSPDAPHSQEVYDACCIVFYGLLAEE